MTTASAYLRRHTLLRRVLIVFLSALVLFFVSYWCAIHYLLNREKPFIIKSNSTTVEIRAESGWSLWPGVLHAKGAFFQVQDYNIEMQIRAETAILDFAPTSALRGIIHIESIKARGTRLRMLARVKDANAARLRMAAFPRLSDRPIYYDAPRKTPPNPAKLKIDKIDAKLSELWILEYHAEGKIKASGSVTIVDDVNINDARVELDDVAVHVGDRLVANQATGTIKANIGPFAVLKPSAEQALKSINSSIKLNMQVRDLSFAEIYSPDGSLRLDGTAQMDLAVKTKEGRLLETSHAKFESDAIEASLEGRTFPFALNGKLSSAGEKRVQLSLQVQALDSKGREPYVWGAERLDIASEFEQPEPLSLRPLQGTLDWKDARLSDPQLPRIVLGDDSLPLLKLDNLSGHAAFERSTEQLDVNLNVASGDVAFFPAEKLSISCSLKAKASCSQSQQDWACAEATVDCQPLGLQRDGESEQMSVHLEAPQLSLKAKGDLKATINFSGSNPKELLLDVAASSVLEKIGVAAAPLGPLSGTANFTLVPAQQGPGTLVAELQRFESGAFSLQGHLVSAYSMKSWWLLELGEIKLGVKQSPAGVKLELGPTKAWLEQL